MLLFLMMASTIDIRLRDTPVSPAITFAQTEESTSGCVSETPPPPLEPARTAERPHRAAFVLLALIFISFFFFTLRYSDVYTCWCVCVSMNVSCDPNVCELVARLFFCLFLNGGFVTSCDPTSACRSFLWLYYYCYYYSNYFFSADGE